jgi:RNA polymerase sigma factor for flagellar operon FliA
MLEEGLERPSWSFGRWKLCSPEFGKQGFLEADAKRATKEYLPDARSGRRSVTPVACLKSTLLTACAAKPTGATKPAVPSKRTNSSRGKREVELVEKYLHLVKSAVDRIKFKLPKTIDEEDLTNSAVIGLIDAVRKYDLKKKTKFETYAMWRIRGAILDELRSLDWASRSARRKARDMQKQLRVLEQKLGRRVSDEEAAESLKITSKDISRVGETMRGRIVLSIDQPVHVEEESGRVELCEVIEDPQAVDMLEAVEEEESRQMMLQCINNLPEQERLVIALYYYEELTLKQIGQVLGISESRASQVHTKAISRLKTRVAKVLV